MDRQVGGRRQAVVEGQHGADGRTELMLDNYATVWCHLDGMKEGALVEVDLLAVDLEERLLGEKVH